MNSSASGLVAADPILDMERELCDSTILPPARNRADKGPPYSSGRRLFSIAGLEQAFPTYDSLEEAQADGLTL